MLFGWLHLGKSREFPVTRTPGPVRSTLIDIIRHLTHSKIREDSCKG